MAEITIIVILLTIVVLLCIKIWWMKKDIDIFTQRLEQCLDMLASETDLTDLEKQEDTLWQKIYGKLLRLEHLWKRKSESSAEERKQIKELVSDISHQTKTPIANLKIYLEILESELDQPEMKHHFIEKMQGQTEKLDFLIQSMVKMSRLETGVIEIHRTNGKIHESLSHAVAAIVPKAEQKEIALYVDCDEQITLIYDKKWTEEALFNILDNAVKYTERGGNIHVSVKMQEFFLKISIKDNGKGIVKDRQAQIFTRFYREPEVHEEEGIGVGLYLARKIATLQKGYIQVVSEVGQGAEFQLYLPAE